jgi:ABC-type Na+ efflux pump permease subunit
MLLNLKLCSSALLFLFIEFFANIYMIANKIIKFDVSLLIKTIFIIFWTLLLNFIHKRGASKIAWALVLLPMFMFLLILLGEDKKKLKDNNYYLKELF